MPHTIQHWHSQGAQEELPCSLGSQSKSPILYPSLWFSFFMIVQQYFSQGAQEELPCSLGSQSKSPILYPSLWFSFFMIVQQYFWTQEV